MLYVNAWYAWRKNKNSRTRLCRFVSGTSAMTITKSCGVTLVGDMSGSLSGWESCLAYAEGTHCQTALSCVMYFERERTIFHGRHVVYAEVYEPFDARGQHYDRCSALCSFRQCPSQHRLCRRSIFRPRKIPQLLRSLSFRRRGHLPSYKQKQATRAFL